jgi:Fur family peroxide stress response transcriptional regulator
MKTNFQDIRDAKRSEFETVCRNNGLALTIQRRTILDALASRNDHPTVDQVYEDIKESLKGISRTTVYRVLETFVSIGIARKINNPESKARFDADTRRHHHLTCIRCGRVLDLHDATLDNLAPSTGTLQEFTILDYSVTFNGICSCCQETDRQSSQTTGTITRMSADQ